MLQFKLGLINTQVVRHIPSIRGIIYFGCRLSIVEEYQEFCTQMVITKACDISLYIFKGLK